MPMTPLPTLDRTSATFKTDVDDFFSTDLPQFVTEANALETAVDADATAAANSASAASTSASNAATSETNAAASASAAATSASDAADSAASAVNAPGTSANSSTSLTIGTGSKAFTIETGKAFAVGQMLIAASAATPANYMIGQITAHNSGTGALTLNVTKTGGSGTLNDWVISLTSTPNTFPMTTKGDLVARDSTQEVRVPVGSDNQVLVADSTQSAGVKWGFSGLNLIAEVNASAAASVDFDGYFSANYDEYVLIADDIEVATTGDIQCLLKVNSAWQSSNYLSTLMRNRSGLSSAEVVNISSGTYIRLVYGCTASSTSKTEIEVAIHNPLSTTRHSSISFRSSTTDMGASQAANNIGVGAYIGGVQAMQGIRIQAATGNISGTFRLYGVSK